MTMAVNSDVSEDEEAGPSLAGAQPSPKRQKKQESQPGANSSPADLASLAKIAGIGVAGRMMVTSISPHSRTCEGGKFVTAYSSEYLRF